MQNLTRVLQSRAEKVVFGAENNNLIAGIILLKLMRITDERMKEQSTMKYLGNKYPEFQRAVK